MKPSELPPRFLKVIKGIATGKPDKQVAAGLGLTYGTFRQYSHSAYQLLGVNSKVEAVNALNEEKKRRLYPDGK